MDKKDVIMLYSDFEGTILRESDGNYDDMEMYNFLKHLEKHVAKAEAIIYANK